MSRRKDSRMIPDLVEGFIGFRRRKGFKDIDTDISLLQGARSGRVTGKTAPAKALAKEFDDIPARRLDADTLGNWELRRNAKSGGAARRRNRFSLRAFIAYGISEGEFPASMLDHFPPLPKPQNVVRHWLTPEQVRFLLRVAKGVLDEYAYFMIVLFLTTGARTEEAFALTTSSLDVSKGELTLIGKGPLDGKARQVPVSKAFIEAWMAHIARHAITPGGYILFSRRPRLSGGADLEWEWVIDYTEPAAPQVIHHLLATEATAGDEPYRGRLTKALADAAATAAPEEQINFKLNPRVFRRTFACLAVISNATLGKGYGLERLQKIMGHEDPATTRLYISDVDHYMRRDEEPLDLMATLAELEDHARRKGASG